MQIELHELIAALSGKSAGTSTPPPVIGKYCIVRCQKAGVHAGTVVRADAEWVVLADSRRLWKWYSGFTLSEAALTGIDTSKSRVAAQIPDLTIPTSDVGEIIPCSSAARSSIESASAADE